MVTKKLEEVTKKVKLKRSVFGGSYTNSRGIPVICGCLLRRVLDLSYSTKRIWVTLSNKRLTGGYKATRIIRKGDEYVKFGRKNYYMYLSADRLIKTVARPDGTFYFKIEYEE